MKMTFTQAVALAGLLALAFTDAQAQVRITEFMANNTHTLADEDGAYSDWIEIYNPGTNPMDLLNWSLTDTRNNLAKWQFPSTPLAVGQYLVVFASGKNRHTSGQPLHTNFKLDAAGEYLGLVMPDGQTITSEYSPVFPPQAPDVSYGYGAALLATPLITTGAVGRVTVPTNGSLGTAWTLPDFNDSAWRVATNGIGYETGQGETPGPASLLLSLNPPGFWRLGELGGNAAQNQGTLGSAANGTISGTVTFNQAGPGPAAYPGFESDNPAMHFDGTNAKIDVPYNASLNPSVFTVSCWARVTGGAGTYRSPLTSRADYPQRGYMFYATDANVWAFQTGQGSGWDGMTGPAVVIGQWVHLVGTYNGSTKRFYVNGSLVGSNASAFSPNTASPLRIGAGRSEDPTGGYFFNGEVDEVAVIGRTLSDAEILQLYQTATTPGEGTGTNTFNYTGLIQTDLRTSMYGANSSAYFRLPFILNSPAQVALLKLRLKYDDGFVAYLNGQPAAGFAAPDSPAWNSAATSRRATSDALAYDEYDVTDMRGFLRAGTNVLAIQGLNYNATNADFLVLPELEISIQGAFTTDPRYFSQPTPGRPNDLGTTNLGPIIFTSGSVPALPIQPATNDSLTITAMVSRTLAPVASVTLNWRVMFGTISQTPMLDDGAHGDGAAGDGVYGAVIPAGVAGPGQIIRWYITATDVNNRSSRLPAFGDPLNSPEYDGTMTQDPRVSSEMPVWHWFGSDYNAAHQRSGIRGAVFFNGGFYDNVFIRQRGGYTVQLLSQKFDFNTGYHCRINDEIGGVEEANLNSNGADPSYMRPPVAFDVFRTAGHPASACQPMLLRYNGGADRVGLYMEQVDARFLHRRGLDEQGALYKFDQRAQLTPAFSDATDGVQKRSRLEEDASDLQTVVNGVTQTSNVEARAICLFDNLNLANVVNYLACRALVRDADDVRKNWYFYRDTLGTREWYFFPWDKDLTLGNDADGGTMTKHPFFGDYVHRKLNPDQWSFMWEAIFNDARTRQMYLRRLRSLMDQQLQPPGTVNGHLEAITDAYFAPAYPFLGSSVSNYVISLKAAYAQRRQELYVAFAETNLSAAAADRLIPAAQPLNPIVLLGAVDANPVSGNQLEEYVQLVNTNTFAADISGWTISGAVQHTFEPGTVILPTNVMYLARDAAAFRARATGPRGGQKLFVQGNYQGQLSARGETLTLADNTSRLVASNSYPGNPSPAQQYLRITELMYNPLPLAGNATDAQEFEFVEFKNTSSSVPLDLRGVHFTNGVEFSFTGSAVTNLGPQQRVLLVKNLAAFAARYGAGVTNIAGAYSGYLNNAGERVTLLDASNEEILDFSYNNTWYPLTDGQGFSLVIVDEQAQPDAWGQAAQWRASAYEGGSPGTTEPNPPSVAPVFVIELLSHPDLGLGQTEAVELFNPNTNAVDVSGWYLTDNSGVPRKYRLPNGTVLGAGGYLVITEAEFNPGGLGFSFSAAGEEVRLFSADTNGTLTGYSHGFTFGAAEAGVSFGRYVNSQGSEDFVAMAAQTFGTNNAAPRVGPVVLNEIMYHPLALTTNDPPASFLELLNITATNVPLFHAAQPTNTWHLRNAVDFDFPTNVTLPPAGLLLVVGFDPVTNTTALAAFRSRYGVATNVPIYGPWQGSLPNHDGAIELKKPDPTVSTNPPYVMVEKVHYYDSPPWPCGTDGTGASLQRQRPGEYGNDPINWAGAPPTTGGSNTIVPPGAPVITTAPVAQTITYGTSASFSVTACGVPQYFQWLFHGTNLAGATNATLLLPNAQASNAGPYAVVVWNSGGAVTSAPVMLSVQAPPPPGLTSQPLSRVIAVSNAVSFSVVATGAPPISFQWRLAGTNLSAATSNPFALASAQFSDAGSYTVIVSNPGGSVTSAPALLTVLQPPAFTSQPQSQSVFAGSNATFTVAVSGSAPVSLQWLFNATNLPNATNTTLTLTNVQASQAGSYQARATNLVGVTFSDAATLIVPVPISILTPPSSQSAWPYSNVTFTVNLTGSQPLTYQWRLAGTNLSGATNASLSLPSVLPPSAGSYAVVVTNTISAVTSAPALLTVFTNPLITAQPAGQSAAAGSNATFTVAAFSSTPLRYQWFFNTTNSLAGATNYTLTFTNVQATNYGYYHVKVSDNFGTTSSDYAQMADKLKPTITQQPAPTNSAMLLGSALNLSISAFGPQPLYFAWQRNGLPVTNSTLFDTNSVLALTNLAFAQAGSYTVTVSNSAGLAPASGRAYVSVMEPLTNQTAWPGSNATFSFQAASSYPNTSSTSSSNNWLKYQWWFNDTNLISTVTNLRATFTNVVLNLTNVQAAHDGIYTVVLTNGNGLTTTQSATLTVLRAPTITRQPTNQTASGGTIDSFSVAADGSGPLSYQWWFNDTNLLPGATAPTLTLTNVQAGQAGGYRVVVSNSVGMITSTVATLLVPTLQVSGQVALGDYMGPARNGFGTRLVTFKATDDMGAVLATWNLSLNFTPDANGSAMAGFTLDNVPPSTAHLSAKTAWHLRQRLAITFTNGTATTSFTGSDALLGGDLNGSNVVDLDDYSQLAGAWYTADPAADIDGSGLVDIFDYFILASHWLKSGADE